jgi:CMP-2-keto-3-deoxyoctulosonic acid synthetase
MIKDKDFNHVKYEVKREEKEVLYFARNNLPNKKDISDVLTELGINRINKINNLDEEYSTGEQEK